MTEIEKRSILMGICLLGMLIIFVGTLVLGGCHTVSGLGKDIQRAADGVGAKIQRHTMD